MKWQLLAGALAVACALLISSVHAQEGREPLIEPRSGGPGSRFQIVGTSGWTAGETVTLRFLFLTSGDPLDVDGPWAVSHTVEVLRDGTWSFPVSVDELFGAPLTEPGFIVVRAESGTRTAQNAFVFTFEGRRPPGADALAPLGFGQGAPGAAAGVTLALFALGGGGLLVASGLQRRRVGA